MTHLSVPLFHCVKIQTLWFFEILRARCTEGFVLVFQAEMLMHSAPNTCAVCIKQSQQADCLSFVQVPASVHLTPCCIYVERESCK